MPQINIKNKLKDLDIKDKFLKYFELKGHQVLPSSPLVPDDPTLLFCNAGMVQFKGVFIGDVAAPNPPRATTAQTCIRAGGKHNDLDNVGYTARHHTFFEMLGNFSFGDYFKQEAIANAWEFVTEILEFEKDKLWVTVHDSDDEAYEIWAKHISPDRIKRFGDKDNFWQMGDVGPCGPCSEIFIDQGEEFGSDEDYLGGDGDRFLEIWNLVFMQYDRDAKGNLTPLPKPSIDTGMGLERVIALKEGVFNNYHSSLFMPLIDAIGDICGKRYEYESKNSASYRVIADHVRSCVFLLAQGVNFDKEGRGYVLRRIVRRAIRHGYLLGIKEPFMYRLVDTLVESMSKHYTYLIEKKPFIKEALKGEEERFLKTIASGLELFEKELVNTTNNVFSGDVAFKLYDTYGFPLDLCVDMLRAYEGIVVDEWRFQELMTQQKERSRANWKGSGDEALLGIFKDLAQTHGTNEFVGYDNAVKDGKVLAVLSDKYNKVEILNDTGWVMFDKTIFYPSGGGQCGDMGELLCRGEVVAQVLDTKNAQGINISKIKPIKPISTGDTLTLKLSKARDEIAKHHSATHLLQSALKTVLGDSVNQAGSSVEKDKLRFDFTYQKALSDTQLNDVQKRVNELIYLNLPNKTSIMNIDDAKSQGAMALFGEKYADDVRVVDFGGVSIELCGGCHVSSSGSIGTFVITKESGLSSGVRRIEAICGASATRYTQKIMQELKEIKICLKHNEPLVAINNLRTQIKELKQELKALAKDTKQELMVTNIDGIHVVVDEVKAGDIKTLIDETKNKNEKVAIMLLQAKEGKVLIACGIKGIPIKAGDWIKDIAPIVGGGGGGRSDFAQAGGKNTEKIGEAKKEALRWLKEKLANEAD